MLATEYDKMQRLEKEYWWFAGRRYLVELFFQSSLNHKPKDKILDVGCGTGEMLKMLGAYGDVTGLDISESALDYCRKKGLKVRKGSALKMPFDDNSFRVITLLDILEHVDKDQKAIQEIFRVCKPQGKLFLTLPAYNFLWSDHDRALQHYRRYSRAEIITKLKKAGFKIEKASYVIFTLFLPILIFRLGQKLFKGKTKKKRPQTSLILLPKPLNQFFIRLLNFESRLLKYTNYPFGVSIVVIASKA